MLFPMSVLFESGLCDCFLARIQRKCYCYTFLAQTNFCLVEPSYWDMRKPKLLHGEVYRGETNYHSRERPILEGDPQPQSTGPSRHCDTVRSSCLGPAEPKLQIREQNKRRLHFKPLSFREVCCSNRQPKHYTSPSWGGVDTIMTPILQMKKRRCGKVN